MPTPSLPPLPPQRWDIFCQVIDNFGDIGVCWRLATDLAAHGHHVRLWADDASALRWMAPQGTAVVDVLPWPTQALQVPQDGPGDIVIEAFGCEIPAPFQQAIAAATQTRTQKPVWINLEYLSAEEYVERCHRLPSRIMSGPAAGCTRWFFYPGFTDKTGGLLRELDLAQRQQQFDRDAWRTHHGLAPQDTAISLFCYEPAALLQMFTAAGPQAQWLVTPGRATDLVQQTLRPTPSNVRFLPPVDQSAFDEMLWACDLNLVRGEDSLVRALWAGQAFVWQIYPQHDNAHHAKLEAFLDWLDAPKSLRRMHRWWNGITSDRAVTTLDAELLTQWRDCTQNAAQRLRAQASLVEQLVAFVAEKG
ncbi:MAG: elongation factor P maturation arginine rhamnosyltransferase EarP [Comamonas sp.]